MINNARLDTTSQQGKEQRDVADFCFLFIYLLKTRVFLLQMLVPGPFVQGVIGGEELIG